MATAMQSLRAGREYERAVATPRGVLVCSLEIRE
jgi:hypothetical protein